MVTRSFVLKKQKEEYKASDYTEDHHNDTESKCLVAVSEFVYQCQGKALTTVEPMDEKKFCRMQGRFSHAGLRSVPGEWMPSGYLQRCMQWKAE